jgi:hypothetical protein
MLRKRSIALFVGVFLCASRAAIASTEDQQKTKEDRLSGTVHMIDKDTSSIVIRNGAVQRRVIYSAATTFTIQNKPGGVDDVIVGRHVVCLGEFNGKTQLVATRIDVRTR